MLHPCVKSLYYQAFFFLITCRSTWGLTHVSWVYYSGTLLAGISLQLVQLFCHNVNIKTKPPKLWLLIAKFDACRGDGWVGICSMSWLLSRIQSSSSSPRAKCKAVSCHESCFFFLKNSIYLFGGCAGCSLLCGLLSSCGKRGLLSSCGLWDSHCGNFFHCGTLGCLGFSIGDTWAQQCSSPVLEHRLGSCSTPA